MQFTKESFITQLKKQGLDVDPELISDHMIGMINMSKEETASWSKSWDANFKPCLNALVKGKYPPQKRFNKLLELGGLQ